MHPPFQRPDRGISATIIPAMLRTELYADPNNVFMHDAVLASCRRHPEKTALVDTSCGRRLTYAEYGETVEALARGLVAAGLKPGEVVAIFLAIRGSSVRLIMRRRWPGGFRRC